MEINSGIAERLLEPGENELKLHKRIFSPGSSGGTSETIELPGAPAWGTTWFDWLTEKVGHLDSNFRIA